MSKPHPEADILRAIADGKAIESRDESTSMAGAWNPATAETVLAYLANRNHRTGVIRFRIRPPTVRIGEFDVPEPVREEPADGAHYWMPSLQGSLLHEGVYATKWEGAGFDYDRLRLGLIHFTAEAAKLHFDALVSFTRSTS